MYDSRLNVEPVSLAPGKRTLLLAVLAPFGAIALLASPLLIDAARPRRWVLAVSYQPSAGDSSPSVAAA